MPYADLTFQVQPGLRFVPNDFVNVYVPTTTTTSSTSTTTTTSSTSTSTSTSTTSTTSTTTTAAPLPVITSGLVLYVDASIPSSYPGTGTTWYDLSPSGYNGTLSGSTAFNSANGGYISLQSNTGYVDFGLSSQGSNTSAYTWGGWFNVPGFTTIPMTRGGGTDSYPNGWNLATVFLSNAFNGSMITSVPGITQTNSSYASSPSSNTWYNHITVWNPGVSLKVYINGVLRATVNTSNTVLRNSSQGWNTSIDGTKGNASYGSMMVYNTVLSDDDVVQNFNSTCTRFGLSPIPTTTTTTTTAGPAIVTSGLIVNLDASNPSSYSGSGTTWTDLTGNGNNMTMSGTVPFAGSGQTKYFSYNGTANFFQGVNNFTSSISNAITISVVANITNISQRSALFSKYVGGLGNANYVFEAGFSSSIRWYVNGTTLSSSDYRGSQSINQNQNYLLTLTYNQSTGANALYVNGTQISANQVSTNSVSSNWSQGNVPFLTGNYGGDASTLNAYMYEYMILVYNTALTAGEVLQNYNALQSRFGL